MSDWDIIHSSKRHDWRTPPEVFRALDAEFKFTQDVAASKDNHLCERYLTEADNALERSWGGTCWCNPPYGRTMMDWVRKCALEAAGGATVVLLCFASTDTAWFRHAWIAASEVRLYTGRISFLTPEGERTTPAPKGSCLFVFRPSTSAGACWARLMEAPNADTDSGGS